MIEISMNDSFGRTIGLYSEKCEVGLEIGGGTGQGSSRCIKNYANYQELKTSSTLLWENWSLRNGAAIFQLTF